VAELRRVRRLAAVLLCGLFGVLIATTVALHHALTGSHRWAVAGARLWFRSLNLGLGMRVRVSGSPPAGASLLAANHISWLDILAIGSVAPTNFVSKAEVRSWPVMGWLAHAGGTLFIPRGAGHARAIAETMGQRLAAGTSVLIFPESTTTDGSGLRPFYPRLFAAVQEAGATIQPIALRYLPPPGWPAGVHPTAPFIDDDPFPDHFLRLARGPAIDVEVHFCEPFPAGPDDDRKSLALRARKAVAEALGMDESGSQPGP